jgi:glycosyltransferase involved in cell wall biosynthesis
VPPTQIFVAGLRGIPDVMGGVETHCEELLPRVATLAPDLSLEVLGRKGFVPAIRDEFRGVGVRGLPAPSRASSEAIVSTFFAVLYAARSGRVIHIHAVGPALLTPVARLLGLRVVLTHHGADYDRAKWGGFAKRMLRLGERLGVGWASQVIAVAPSLAENLQSRYPRQAHAISYIPNGAPTLPDDLSATEIMERFDLRPRGYVLTVGRLVPEKGFDRLIDALEQSGDTRTLVIAGSDIHGSPWSQQLQNRASHRVRFVGSQPRAVLRRLYEQADLFVLPSFHEGLPISALEAASCGTPLLLSDIQPNLDLGLGPDNYFPVGNVDALAECLRSPAERFRFDIDGMRQRFDWDRIAEQTLEVYRRVTS